MRRKRTTLQRVTPVCLAAFVAALMPFVSCGEDEDLSNDACLMCHGDSAEDPFVDPDAFAASVHGENECVSCHDGIAEIPHAESLKPVDCGECHATETERYSESSHGLALAAGGSMARSCRDCHGGHHAILGAEDPESPIARKNIAATCAGCHADTERMQGIKLTQSAPISSFDASVHGLAWKEDEKTTAAVCTDCHGSHDLYRATEAASKLHWRNIPETCGKCHENIRNTFERSVHGIAVSQGNRDAPVCTDCHGEHSIDAVAMKTSSVYPSHITETCGQCHAAKRIVAKYGLSGHAVDTYMDSYHGLSLQLGSARAANCASCHGAHDILPSADPRSSVHKGNLTKTCGRCHPGVSDLVADGQIHSGTQSGQEHPTVRMVRRVYVVLIVFVLGGMFIHNAMDFVKKVREHCLRAREQNIPYRMDMNERIQHAVLTVTFVALGYSGFALKFPCAWWAHPFYGAPASRDWLHRAAAVLFCVLCVYHVIYLACTRRGRRQFQELSFRKADFVQPFQMIGFYLGLRDHKPVFAHYSYVEKMEYWALVWGSIIMVLTGALLAYEDWTLRWFPVWVVDLATTIHYYEAILACCAILLWHMYFVMFDPDEYPMKHTWISGRGTEADLQHRDTDGRLD